MKVLYSILSLLSLPLTAENWLFSVPPSD
jgi:hypothetical protein